MRTILGWALCALCGLLCGLIPVRAWAAPVPPGSAVAAYLSAHPVLKVGVYDSGWPPFESVREGRVSGLGPDLLEQLAASLGVRLEYVFLPGWTEVLDAACRGEIDVVMSIVPATRPQRCLVYTAAYASAPLALVGRAGDLRSSERSDLAGLRVVTEAGFLTGPRIGQRFPDAHLLTATDTTAALRQVAAGTADVFVGNVYVAETLLGNGEITGLELLRPSGLAEETLHFGVPSAAAPLREALDAALAALPLQQRTALSARWLRVPVWSDPARQALDAAERRVLSTPLRIGYPPNAAPLSFIGADGQPSGLAADYLQRLRAVGATLQPVSSHDWYELRAELRAGRVDAALGVPNDSTWLGRGWVFSQPFISVPNVIVTGPASGTVLDMKDLAGKRVLLSDPDRLRARVLQRAPGARIIAARSTEQALQRLLEGEAEAYIGNLAVVDRLLRERFPAQLKVAAPAGFDDSLSLVAKQQYAPLVTRFDRLLQQLPVREREALRNDWLKVEYHSGQSWRSIARWGIPIVLVLLAALLVHALGYWRLRREIAGRRRLEQRLAEVTDNLPAVVYQMRRRRDGTLEFPYIAGDMRPLFGVDREAVTQSSATLLDSIDARDRSAVHAAVEQAARDFLPLAFEFRTTPAGGARWIRSQAQPYATENGTVTWSGYWVDVSQARAQSDALVDARGAAEDAAQAKAQLLAMMSHEIRTPMSGVLGLLEMLAHSPLQQQQRVVLREAETAAQALHRMLDDILDYAKIDAGALHLDPLPLPLHPLLEGIRRQFAAAADARGLLLTLQVAPALASAHEVDGLRLRQVLHNLVENALHFTRAGSVSLRLDVLEDHAPGLQSIRLRVTDTGTGIGPAQLEAIRQGLASGGAAMAEDVRRTGLGLGICHRLVQLMGGTLVIRSQLGSGTEVDVLLQLPVASEADLAATLAGAQHVAPLPDARRGARVLVVEDHPTAMAMMAWRLQQLGVEHAVAGNGREALELMAATAFDLVITDCRMPVMDGYAFTRVLREREGRNGGARTPVVALTASILDEEIRQCREAGMDDVLTKPLSLADLRASLLKWLPVPPIAAR